MFLALRPCLLPKIPMCRQPIRPRPSLPLRTTMTTSYTLHPYHFAPAIDDAMAFACGDNNKQLTFRIDTDPQMIVAHPSGIQVVIGFSERRYLRTRNEDLSEYYLWCPNGKKMTYFYSCMMLGPIYGWLTNPFPFHSAVGLAIGAGAVMVAYQSRRINLSIFQNTCRTTRNKIINTLKVSFFVHIGSVVVVFIECLRVVAELYDQYG